MTAHQDRLECYEVKRGKTRDNIKYWEQLGGDYEERKQSRYVAGVTMITQAGDRQTLATHCTRTPHCTRDASAPLRPEAFPPRTLRQVAGPASRNTHAPSTSASTRQTSYGYVLSANQSPRRRPVTKQISFKNLCEFDILCWIALQATSLTEFSLKIIFQVLLKYFL